MKSWGVRSLGGLAEGALASPLLPERLPQEGFSQMQTVFCVRNLQRILFNKLIIALVMGLQKLTQPQALPHSPSLASRAQPGVTNFLTDISQS